MPRPEVLAFVNCDRALLGDASANAVRALRILRPNATEPSAPIDELARPRILDARFDDDACAVTEEKIISRLANHLV